MTTSTATTRINWLDIGKGIAIVAVILGHSIPGLGLIKSAIFSFHMPLFFIYAGYTFKQKPLDQILITSFKRLLVPFFSLFVLNSVFVVLRHNSFSFNTVYDLMLSLAYSSAVRNNRFPIGPVGMIWFFVVLFEARIFFSVILSICEKTKLGAFPQLCFWSITTVIGISIGRRCFLPLSIDLVPMACLFMFFGHYANRTGGAEMYVSIPFVSIALAIWLYSVTNTFFSMGDRMFSHYIISIPAALAGTLLITKASILIDRHGRHIGSFLSFLGRDSLYILSVHYIESHAVGWESFALLDVLPHRSLFVFLVRISIIGTLYYLSRKTLSFK